MIVCSCYAVTDRDIRHAAWSGARTACQVAELCGAGSGCGGCRETVHELLAESHGERHMHTARLTTVVAEAVPA